MKKNILLTLPKLNTSGGVSSFWNSLLPVLKRYKDLNIETFEIGGHGKNIIGPVMDQWNFYRKTMSKTDLAVLNPSLGSKSFFRDAFFAKRLRQRNIPFLVFFHGWNLDFEKKIDTKYVDFFLNSFGKADKICVLSKNFKDKILEWGYEGEVVIETTNVDSVLLEGFSIERKLYQLEHTDRVKILFLARLLPEKGIFETIEAFELLQDSFENIELIIAGDGQAYDEVTMRVKDNDRIVTVGHVEGKTKIELFENSHIYCLPSYSEGLPISILEAMAFGLPVITTEVGGLKGFFKNRQMGFFVAVKDKAELSEKLKFLILNPKERVKIGEYNYRYANNKLLNTVVAERIYQHMKSILFNCQER